MHIERLEQLTGINYLGGGGGGGELDGSLFLGGKLDCFFTPEGGGGGGEKLYSILGKAWGEVHRFGGKLPLPLRPPPPPSLD